MTIESFAAGETGAAIRAKINANAAELDTRVSAAASAASSAASAASSAATAAAAAASAAAAKYTLPGAGIPATDMAAAVQASLGKADSAAQVAGDIGGTAASPTVAKINGLTLPENPSTAGYSLQWDGTALVWAAGAGGLPSGMTYASPATTTGDAVLEVLGTFNGSGQVLKGLSVEITNSASATLSTTIHTSIGVNTLALGIAGAGRYPSLWLLDNSVSMSAANPVLQVVESSVYMSCNVNNGQISIGDPAGSYIGISSSGLKIAGSKAFGFSSGSVNDPLDATLFRDAANVLAQRNGTAAQESRIYRSYVDGSNLGYTGLKQDATAGFILDSVYSGSVSAPTNLLDVRVNGASKARLSSGGVLSILQTTYGDIQLALSNGVDTLDIGALGSYLSQIAANNSIVLKSSGLSIQSQGAPFSSAPININSNGISVYKTGFLFGRHAGAASSTPVTDNKTWLIHEAQANNDVAPIFTIASGAADPAATTNIVGGTININGGDGASSSSGDAHGGPLNLNGGRGYGTGRHGSIAYGTVRGSLVPGGALSTTMTDGFLNIPSGGGPPSGVPSNTTGTPLYFDSTNLKLYAYTGATWKSSAAFA